MTAPGWYPDPHGRAEFRWWDGSVWTASVSRGGQTFVESEPSQAAAATATVPMATSTAAKPPIGAGQIIGYILALLIGVGAGWGIGSLTAKDTPSANQTPGGATPTVGTTQPPSTPTGQEGAILPLQAGLDQLDSYRLVVSQTAQGPTAADRNDTVFVLQRNTSADAAYTSTNTTSASAESPEPSNSVSETWTVASERCEGSDGTFTLETRSPARDELEDALQGLLDLAPSAPQPTRVGDESMNGVATVHYSFQLPGLGGASGATVFANQGDYWLAADGGYLVKYVATLDMRTGPAGAESEIYVGTLSIDVLDINASAPVTIPEACRTPAPG